MIYRTVLALHIIAMVSWMAGILYLIRLFVYHSMESEEVVRTRLRTMEYRLYSLITFPAMFATVVFGLSMIAMQPEVINTGWLQLKLVLVALLAVVTLYSGRTVSTFNTAQGRIQHSTKFYRCLNELPTLLMIAIVLLAILRPF